MQKEKLIHAVQFHPHTKIDNAKLAVSNKQRLVSPLNEILAKTSGEELYNPAFPIGPQSNQIKWFTIPAVHYFANVTRLGLAFDMVKTVRPKKSRRLGQHFSAPIPII